MIVWSDKIRKSNDIFKSVTAELLKLNIDLDGVIEIFNNGIEQGTLLKIFDTYDPSVDICIWAYLPQERDCDNQMEVLIGHHSDCTDNNMWKDNLKPKIFTQTRARELHKEVRDYILEVLTSRLDKKINRKENFNG